MTVGASYARWSAGQLDPIGIFLVTSGSTGDRLLFRYPPLPLASNPDASMAPSSAASASAMAVNSSAGAVAAAAAAAVSSPSKSVSSAASVNSVAATAAASSPATAPAAALTTDILASSSGGAQAIAAAAAAAAASAASVAADAASVSSQFSLLVHTGNNSAEVTVCLPDEALASILSAKAVMTQRAFEIKVDDIVFLGYSESLSAAGDTTCSAGDIVGKCDNASSGVNDSSSLSLAQQHQNQQQQQQQHHKSARSSISTFCIIFAVKCSAPKSINKLYIQLARQLTTALRHEEKRCRYLHNQQDLINQLMSEFDDARQDKLQIVDRLSDRCQLCGSLTTVFRQICKTGRVSLRVNNWLPVSFCLAHKMHRLAGRCYVLPSLVESCLAGLQPYHCILPLIDVKSNPNVIGGLDGCPGVDLPIDCNPLLLRFLRALAPEKTLLDVRLETDIAYSVALQLAQHLIRWGWAIVCHPISETNVYVLNPRMDVLLEESPNIIADYQSQCDKFSQPLPSLAEVLAAFSLHAPLGDLRDREPAADLPPDLLTWLIRRRLLLQLHTYVTFLPDPIDVTDAVFGGADNQILPQLPARLRERLAPCAQLVIQRLPQSAEPADLELLADAVDLLELDESRSCHIEHLAHHLVRHRSQIVALVDKFQPILVATMLPDRACQPFFGLS